MLTIYGVSIISVSLVESKAPENIVFLLPETIKQNSTFRAKALRRKGSSEPPRACLHDPTWPGRDERWDRFDVLK